MGNDKQIQKAGDGSQQIQAETVIINSGITEQRAREIFDEMNRLAMQERSEEANRIANLRVVELEKSLSAKFEKVEELLPAFSDPAFQLLIKKAQLSAAVTERTDDYNMLSELLVCHVQKGNDRKNRAGISRAIEIVGDIDNDALCALTVTFAALSYFSIANSISDSLSEYNELLNKLMYLELPSSSSWLDHLDTLGAVRLNSIGSMKKFDDINQSKLPGIVCAGIKIDSDEYETALRLLDEQHISRETLMKNECLDGYVRLPLIHFDSIDDVIFKSAPQIISLSNSQKDAIRKIWELYSKDTTALSQAKNNFAELWNQYSSLRSFRQWWDSISGSFAITQVGKILAHTNAKRCDPSIPDLI